MLPAQREQLFGSYWQSSGNRDRHKSTDRQCFEAECRTDLECALTAGLALHRFMETIEVRSLFLVGEWAETIGLFKPCRAHYRAIQPPFGSEDAPRVDQDHLRIGFLVAIERDTHHPRPRGLRLGAGIRDLLADVLVHQRGFARIGLVAAHHL